MSDTSPQKTPLLGVDWLRTVAGALAAVSTTVLLSTLGAAGTLLGAALGSIAATIGTALYSQGLDRSRQRMRQVSGLRTGSIAVRDAVRGADRNDPAPRDESAEPAQVGWLDRLRQIGWRRLLVPALALFLVVVAAVTVFELLAGRTLASTVRGQSGGGTTISHVTKSGGGGSPTPTPPTGGATPTGTPSTGASTPTPSGTPSSEPSETPSADPTSTSSPSVESTPSGTPEPSFGSTPSVSASPDAPADQVGQ